MSDSIKNVFKMEEYQNDICEVYNFQIEKVIKDHYPTKVVQVHKTLDPNRKWAVKMCYKDKTHKCISAERHFLTEVIILRGLKHPFIMGLDNVASFPYYFCFVMPFYEDGMLTKALPTMTHELRDECLVQLCCGIKFLHDRGVAHRDLKSDNILLTMQKNVVIADFGLGDYVWRREPLVTGKKGTYMHISPEQGEEPFNCFKCKFITIFFRDILSCLLEADPIKRLSVLSLINLLSNSKLFDHRIKLLRVSEFQEKGLCLCLLKCQSFKKKIL
ncbi:uncharacterized protein LOC106070376 [Biomphalaria glabrata]|uniref:Uncharacterized protein LOC106070376 n=1 Tax=Biomphalaria glabrata TaxID=6526 RepID=A0A9W3BIB6_BIOGL|nr:uncharacterized protein LOC106070376 [Biomphalaria glabrata]